MAVELRLLGEVQALRDGTALDIGHARQCCVLAALLTPWTESARVALDAERLTPSPERNDAALRAGRHGGLLGKLAAVAERPWDERVSRPSKASPRQSSSADGQSAARFQVEGASGRGRDRTADGLGLDERRPPTRRAPAEETRSRGEPDGALPARVDALLHQHIATFGTAPDGRLFPGERAGELPKLTYMRAWRAARRRAFTKDAGRLRRPRSAP